MQGKFVGKEETMFFNIKMFEPKWVQKFNKSYLQQECDGNKWIEDRLMVLDRGGTFTLAVAPNQPQVLGFPQIVVDGHCTPISCLKEEVRSACKGAERLEKLGITFLVLRQAKTKLKMYCRGYRGDAEFVETYYRFCREASSDKFWEKYTSSIKQGELIKSFFEMWSEVSGYPLEEHMKHLTD